MLELLYLFDLKDGVLFTPTRTGQNILPISNEYSCILFPLSGFRHIKYLVPTSSTLNLSFGEK
jgi:hypothetical protein